MDPATSSQAPGARGEASPDEPAARAVEALLLEASNHRAVGDPAPMIPRVEQGLETLDATTVLRDPDLRAALLLELATLHDEAFDRDADLEHLRSARALLDRLVAETELHGYAASLVDEALAARDRVDDRLLGAEALEPDSPPMTTDGAAAPDRGRAPIRTGRGLRITGWVLGGAALGAAAASLAGLALGASATRTVRGTTAPMDEPTRIEAIARGHQGNRLALGAGIAASALLVGSATTLVIGYVLRRRARRGRPTTRRPSDSATISGRAPACCGRAPSTAEGSRRSQRTGGKGTGGKGLVAW
ncbi:MAG: hypothetical protein KDK70_11375 [Myxococcales bacterium]|nr:hypothetical protein [Myxococcales bacterium]